MKTLIAKSAIILSFSFVTAIASIILSSMAKMDHSFAPLVYIGILFAVAAFAFLSFNSILKLSELSDTDYNRNVLDTILSANDLIDGNEAESEVEVILPEERVNPANIHRPGPEV